MEGPTLINHLSGSQVQADKHRKCHNKKLKPKSTKNAKPKHFTFYFALCCCFLVWFPCRTLGGPPKTCCFVTQSFWSETRVGLPRGPRRTPAKITIHANGQCCSLGICSVGLLCLVICWVLLFRILGFVRVVIFSSHSSNGF